jgi:hypothetical protein
MTEYQERLTVLLDRLIAATKQKQVEWTATEDDNTAFDAVLPSGHVRIRSVDRDDGAPFRFAVFPPGVGEKRAIDTLSSDWVGDRPADWNEKLEELYGMARSGALKIDVVIDGLIADIETGNTSPAPDFPTAADDDIPF